MNELPDDNYEKITLQEAFNDDVDEYERIFNAGYVLGNLYGTLQIEIYQFYHAISYECIAKNNYNVEFILTEFRKLEKMINMFDPLLQCMNKALTSFKSKRPVYKILSDNIIKYKEINDFLLESNLQNLKNESSNYASDVLNKFIEYKWYYYNLLAQGVEEINPLNKLAEINEYHFGIICKDDKINDSNYRPFVMEYINQFENLSNHKKKLYPDPNHVNMRKKVEEGVQMFCKDFGFDFEEEIGNNEN
ncbi:uncharacterized protein LOC126905707 [Daktulosphaira vitifoliae]|uniref:uncharacterized protein LOC126905707 n=1 Tax=Daktulosphaira vitifoliae TaxID=58002 RepID=UPI0021AA87CC|nr:uncharacterized protein LOC126905707 [Daktulosphaira vitifoliae]